MYILLIEKYCGDSSGVAQGILGVGVDVDKRGFCHPCFVIRLSGVNGFGVLFGCVYLCVVQC